MRVKSALILLGFLIIFCDIGHAAEGGKLYAKAYKSAKAGDIEFAFMQYRSLLRNYPNSRFKKEALFAKGEYYFLISRYKEAALAFQEYIKDYPDSKGAVFALLYLFKIAEIKKDALVAENIKKMADETTNFAKPPR